MALPSSGPISSSMIQTEFGGSNPIAISEYYKGGANVPNTGTNANIPTSGQIKFSDFYNGSDLESYEYLLDSGSDSGVCSGGTPTTVYQTVSTFSFSEDIYSDAGLTTPSISGFYSNEGIAYREWSGTAWLGGGAFLCGLE
jgi:hypothetical protein